MSAQSKKLFIYHRWGQICILESLANYKPINGREAEDIVEKVIPRLQHANASVVLAAVKVNWQL
jgi:vesicle coat complex subunit